MWLGTAAGRRVGARKRFRPFVLSAYCVPAPCLVPEVHALRPHDTTSHGCDQPYFTETKGQTFSHLSVLTALATPRSARTTPAALPARLCLPSRVSKEGVPLLGRVGFSDILETT